jgi:predicted RNA-binding protein YlxR (DUF448 family)
MLRTCVGCRATVEAVELVRLVLSPEGDLVVDLHGGSFGRGAWVHARPSCLAAAPASLSRALRATVRSTPGELHSLFTAAAARRIQGLILAARRTRRLDAGASAVQAAVEGRRAALLVVATDARAAAEHGWLAPLVANGSALAWGEKALFGAWLSRPDTALLAITDRGLAQEIRKMIDWTMFPEPSAPAKRARRTVSSEAG